ncbi:hypothetical protein IQ268_08740 [Oculatella sp. LEGE 06141]|uniref:hypothetical protein n=1 Tax=Oculatella sp. LEGE 06141 TaxID=1828648 RepID=UPI00187F66EB|nr:hypothetical protein [Oculatella sp. LEGE 06141]MBE9178645.1 hypothetical protein [Oculatella sp. LEGE 06141]
MPRLKPLKPLRVRRTVYILDSVDKALGHTSIEVGQDKSDLVTEALRQYLPKISNLPVVLELLERDRQIAS